jgi:hypothetical protein
MYLDGMSKHLHGDPATQQRDRQICAALRNQDYQVFEIPCGDLDNRQAMAQHFYRLGRVLLGKAQATTLRDNVDWFDPMAPSRVQSRLQVQQELARRSWRCTALDIWRSRGSAYW